MSPEKFLPYGQTQAMNAVINDLELKMSMRLIEADIAIERGVKRYRSDQDMLCTLRRIDTTNKKISMSLETCASCGVKLSNE